MSETSSARIRALTPHLRCTLAASLVTLFLLGHQLVTAFLHAGPLDGLSVWFGLLAFCLALPALGLGLRQLIKARFGVALGHLAAGLLGAVLGYSLLVLAADKVWEDAERLH